MMHTYVIIKAQVKTQSRKTDRHIQTFYILEIKYDLFIINKYIISLLKNVIDLFIFQ